MSRLDRYIFRSVVGAALLALLVLLGLESFFTLLSEMGDMRAGYGVQQVLMYLLLSMPQSLYQIFPMALLLGGLLGMGALAQTNELTAMRSAGVSVRRLVVAALQAGLILSLVGVAVGEFLAPDAKYAAEELRSSARRDDFSIRGGRGFWARDGDRFVNVRGVLPGLRLQDIYVYEIGGSAELRVVLHAAQASYQDGHWWLEGVRRSLLDDSEVVGAQLDLLSMESVITPDMLEVLAADPDELAMRDLRIYTDYLETNGLNADPYKLAFWTKALGPLSSLAMLFIAMPFVFAPQRSAGVGQRLVLGIVLGLAFYLGNRLLGNLVLLYGYPPLVGAALPSLIFFGLGAWLLGRLR